ncbi:MAG TPA: EamA family transporter [Candidatus Angelobacter sp.]|nr:EamA family transporter [Candidatus Angelobacter sp.]
MSEEKRHQFRIALAFAAVYVLWGATYLAMRVAVGQIPAYVLGAVRYGIAGPLMLAWCALAGKKVRITRRDALRLLAIGILLLSVANMGVAGAEEYVPSGLAALIVAGVPIWVAIVEAWIFRSRRLSTMGLAGLALGIIGLLVLLWPKISGAHLDQLELMGFGILVMASVSWALGSVLSGRWSLSVDIFTASAWEMTLAGAINGLVALVTGRFHHVVWTSHGVLAIVYLVIGGSWIGFTAYIWLLEHVPTPKVATYAYVNPVVAVCLGWLFLNEKVDLYMLIGTVIIISAVALVNLSKLRALKGGAGVLSAVEPAGDD